MQLRRRARDVVVEDRRGPRVSPLRGAAVVLVHLARGNAVIRHRRWRCHWLLSLRDLQSEILAVAAGTLCQSDGVALGGADHELVLELAHVERHLGLYPSVSSQHSPTT